LWILPTGEQASVAWSREGQYWKAELVGFAPGEYRLHYAGADRTVRISEEGRLNFSTEFGATVVAVILAFVWGRSYLRRKERIA
jgi:hypothetical protein